MNKTLYYAHDPMCSWCWGFEPTRKEFFDALPSNVNVVRLVGGLASDSQDPMQIAQQEALQGIWQKIQQAIPATSFNYNFWKECKPRRSTYPSNRAVIAARLQGGTFDILMTNRIQKAYYTQAKNPSDNALLIKLAEDIGLDVKRFSIDIKSRKVQHVLEQELSLARSLGLNSFPSLAYQVGNKIYPLSIDYLDANSLLTQINTINVSNI